MPWHVVQGKYYMAYGGGAQPYNLYRSPGALGAVIVFTIQNGLVGTGKNCQGKVTTGPDETHVDVGGVTVAVAAQWSAGDSVFDAGGKARLYLPPGLSADQRAGLIGIFQGETTDPNFAVFSSFLSNTTTGDRWLPAKDLVSAIQIRPAPGTNRIDITAPAVTAGGAPLGVLKMTALAGHPSGDYRLVNAAPTFRLGGQHVTDLAGQIQSVDLQGVTLATVENSTWSDVEVSKTPLDIGGHGEMREFNYSGGDNLSQVFVFVGEPVPFLYRVGQSIVIPKPGPGPDPEPNPGP